MAAQRSDAFFGPVFIYLEVATKDQSDAWLQADQPADPLPDQPASAINTATLVDIAAACFLDDEGVLRRHRLRTRNCHRCEYRATASTAGSSVCPAASVSRCSLFSTNAAATLDVGDFWTAFPQNCGGRRPWPRTRGFSSGTAMFASRTARGASRTMYRTDNLSRLYNLAKK